MISGPFFVLLELYKFQELKSKYTSSCCTLWVESKRPAREKQGQRVLLLVNRPQKDARGVSVSLSNEAYMGIFRLDLFARRPDWHCCASEPDAPTARVAICAISRALSRD